ncbi:Purine nucleoside phosphorylase 1 [Chlamydia abortus]|uniref:purine-nucleoside phosphorylase n=1 Tax=unclassified Paenibacillus TaxID=185978 RepID=UPI000A27F8C1|nr:MULTISPECIES: purine-nucleoside phosphorylase [Paenibacillaceae]SHE11109.1 Purine nucleoside phosphorylase 1 [Chlamydia abortus]
MTHEEQASTYAKIEEAAQWIRQRIAITPSVGLILGSGLGVLADSVERPAVLPYRDIPHFPVSTVEGHAGELIVGTLDGRPLVMMKGRFHLYEGYDGEAVTLPVRVMKALGVRTLLVTNSAGGINPDYRVGDFMLIRDHINFMFRNPLIGPNDGRLGPRFPDMSEGYSRRLLELARQAASELGLEVREGVYVGMTGPTYETPAEVRMLRKLGGDAAGMSTVPEVIAARHSGMEVFGVSCITNMAAGMLDQPLSHDEVVATANRVRSKFIDLMRTLLSKLN